MKAKSIDQNATNIVLRENISFWKSISRFYLFGWRYTFLVTEAL